jgi:hypothetical protein
MRRRGLETLADRALDVCVSVSAVQANLEASDKKKALLPEL